MREADNAADLASEGDAGDGARSGGCSRAVYELTGLLVHIMDEAEAPVEGSNKAKNRPPAEQEGTVVAHIKVCLPFPGQPGTWHVFSVAKHALAVAALGMTEAGGCTAAPWRVLQTSGVQATGARCR